jgi:tRNA nucleotidyltransferase (CCA-adding enzyme)
MGYKPGPLFKELIDSILEAKLEGEVSTREDEIEFLRENFPAANPATNPFE